jgi:outer membrane protein assembly factor BamE (lipoprotein component of BamABCDE complex)
MYFRHKFIYLYLFSFFIILIGCQLQEPFNNHGIVFLENRSKKLEVNVSNKNDVLKIIGQPHTKSISDLDEWFYIERILTKGEYHKLGQNILKTNNVLILKFDKYGILKNKKLLNKEDIKKIAFSENTTDNELTQKSFVEKFLSSIKAKMYGNR